MTDRNGRKRPERQSAARSKADDGERPEARKNDAKVKLKPGFEGGRTLNPDSPQSHMPR